MNSPPITADRARENMPSDPEGLRSAAIAMVTSGLTDHDVAQALRVNVTVVRMLTGTCGDCDANS